MRSKTDRDAWSLRGQVHTCRIRCAVYFRQCSADACETEERKHTTTLEFRANGSLAHRSHQNPDGSEWTTTYEYDDSGRLTTTRTENNAGLVDLQINEYSATGQLLRVIARPNGGGDRIAENYEYDTAGRKKKTFYLDLAAHGPIHFWLGVEGTDSGYGAPGAATVTTMYNEREQPSDLHFHDAAGRLLSRVEFKYDRDGNLIEEAQTHVAEMLPPEMLAAMNPAQLETVRALFGAGAEPMRRMHRYNEQGRRAETSLRMGPLSEDKTTLAYNGHGDQIEEISEHDERDYGLDDEGRFSGAPTSERVSRSEAHFRYDYDTFGNWVMKTIESRGGTDQDFTVSSVERRTIGYFE